jgi:uncharacterized membrane protein
MSPGFEIAFDRPWFLLLFLLVPVVWWMGFNSLAGLGPWRRVFALLLRSLVVSLLVLALAQTQVRQTTDRLTVIYLLDQSDSIPPARRDMMLDYVFREVESHRRDGKKDLAGVIVFGGTAKIEAAPFDGKLPLIDRLESSTDLKTDSTSLESALKLAKASFPEDTARRVVIVSDGNENMGDALSLARSMAEDGIGIDVVPVALSAKSEIAVEKIVLPTELRKGQAFEARIVINNQTDSPDESAEPVTGKLRLTMGSAKSSELLTEQQVTLRPGKNIHGFKHELERAGVFTLDATFVPDDPSVDAIENNNRASSFAHIRGKGRVLLIEDGFSQGEFQHLVERLQASSIEIDVMPSNQLYTSAAELLPYDAVVLANVARATGDDADSPELAAFSDAQIKMLVDNCEQMGCGIVMLGGDRSFGAGGWSNTPLEKAMPVDFQIKNDKVSAVGALAMVMHASEMANGNFWQVKIGEEAIKVLGPMDYCGVVDWSDMGGTPKWLWRMPDGVDRVFQNRNRMLGMVNRMTPGDMPDFNAPMRLMLNGLKQVNASIKHAIIISDGDPTPPTKALLRSYVKNRIKISTVAVGTHGPPGSTPLQKIAKATGGKYWVVKDPRALPKIYQREARRVAKPVIKESKTGMTVVPTESTRSHEMLSGLEPENLPTFSGYVMTTVKPSNLVQQLCLSSEPKNDKGENSTLLATWRYGNGRTVAFTSDAGHRWTNSWFQSEQYDKFFSQMVRYAMRPVTQSANFSVASEVKDGVAKVVVTALDDKDDFLNFLDISGRGVGPDQEGFDLEFDQVGPGRYVAQRPVSGSGNFLFSLFPGEGYQRLTSGFNIPWSSEYSDRRANRALLDSLARFEPRGGEAGTVIDGSLTRKGLSQLLETNTFRPTLSAAIGIEDIWPLLLVICSTAFFADVLVRRVAISFEWLGNFWRYLKSFVVSSESAAPAPSLSRLQSRKQEIEKEIEQRRAATRFEPEVDGDATSTSGKQHLENVLASEMEKTPAAPPKIKRDTLNPDDDTSYTSRLLEAKRKAQEKQKRNNDASDSSN